MASEVLVHKHLIIRAEAVSPPMDTDFLTKWLEDLLSLLI
jgi:hypothetical protein